MRHGPYQFKRDDAFRFANHVGIKTWVRDGELYFKTCPFCHGQGNENEKKFSINLETGVFHCFRAKCGRSGNMLILAREFDFSLGTEVDEYYKPKPTRRTFGKLAQIVPKPAAVQYLNGRGISQEITERYQITTQREHDNILVFPFINPEGVVSYVKYRDLEYQKGGKKNKEWCQPNGTPILFGMDHCNLENHTLIICEGQIDSLSVTESGIENAVSVPTGARGFTWTPFCWDWIHNNFNTIIVFGDHENGHVTLLDDIKKRFELTIRCVREEDYKDCKDANAILQKYGRDQVRACVENATIVPIKDVIQLADVEYVDIYSLEKVKTGFRWLDRLLDGGIPFGGVVLISGKSGLGKSTFASQIVMNAVQQGYVAFAYSGELPNYIFKSWIDFQIAGPNHVIEQRGRFDETTYAISKKNQDIIRNWYRDKIYLYDCSQVSDEVVDLIKIIKRVVVQYNARVILLDNLMTAMSESGTKGENELEKQKNFVNALRNIGMMFNVLILLVAHKRKNSMGSETGDDISGSANIYNLALMNISYDAEKDSDTNDRILRVTKNRYFGKIDTTGIYVHYNEKSKRIFGDQDDVYAETECFRDDEVELMDVPSGDINMDNPFN